MNTVVICMKPLFLCMFFCYIYDKFATYKCNVQKEMCLSSRHFKLTVEYDAFVYNIGLP